MKHLLSLSAALGLALVGCGKDDPATGGGTDKAPATTAQGAAVVAPAKEIQAPAELLLYGGSNGTEDAVKQLKDLAAQVVPEIPDLVAMVGPALQNEFRLKDAAAIDTKKPMRFAIFDQKTYGRSPETLMLGVTSPDAFAAALPDHEKTQNVEGNAWSYLKFPGSKSPMYINFVGGYAVVTRHKDLFPKNKDFFEALGAATLPDAGGLVVELENVVRLYGPEIDQSFKQMAEMMTMAAQASPQAKGQVETVQGMITWLQGAMREARQLRASLVIKDGVQLDLRLVPKAGSPLAKTISELAGTGKSDLLAKIPADAPFFFAAAIDPAKAAELSAKLNEAFMVQPIFKGNAAQAKPYGDAMRDYILAMDGQVVVAAHPSPAGLQLLGLFGVADQAKLKTAHGKLSELYTDPAAVAYYDAMGVGMELQKNAYTVGNVSVDITRTTLKNMPPEAMVMMGAMGDLFVQHIAVGEKLGIMAYGEAGKASIEGILGNTLKGGLDQAPGAKRAISGAAPGFFGLLYLNPIELAKGVKLGGMNPLATMLAEVKADTGIAISQAVTDGALRMVLDIPLDTMKQGFAAFEKTKGSF